MGSVGFHCLTCSPPEMRAMGDLWNFAANLISARRLLEHANVYGQRRLSVIYWRKAMSHVGKFHGKRTKITLIFAAYDNYEDMGNQRMAKLQ